jgi:hypothetical protein
MKTLLFLLFATLIHGRLIVPKIKVDEQKDSHGCLTKYTYCNYTSSCIRSEDPCVFNYEPSPVELPRVRVYEIEL